MIEAYLLTPGNLGNVEINQFGNTEFIFEQVLLWCSEIVQECKYIFHANGLYYVLKANILVFRLQTRSWYRSRRNTSVILRIQ